MDTNKTGRPAFAAGRYFTYAIGEIILVVIGILIAIQLNDWSHYKFDYTPRRSTISDANKRRSYLVFEDIYNSLVKKYLPELSDSHNQLLIDKKVYAIDSTTIKLFQPIFNCVGRSANSGKHKG